MTPTSELYANSLYLRFMFNTLRNPSDLELLAYLTLGILHFRTLCNSTHTCGWHPCHSAPEIYFHVFYYPNRIYSENSLPPKENIKLSLPSCYLSLMYSFGLWLITSTVNKIIVGARKSGPPEFWQCKLLFEDLDYEYVSFLF